MIWWFSIFWLFYYFFLFQYLVLEVWYILESKLACFLNSIWTKPPIAKICFPSSVPFYKWFLFLFKCTLFFSIIKWTSTKTNSCPGLALCTWLPPIFASGNFTNFFNCNILISRKKTYEFFSGWIFWFSKQLMRLWIITKN